MVEVTDQVDPPAADHGKRPIVEPEATLEIPIHPQDHDLSIPSQKVTLTFWPSNVDNLHRPCELRSNLKHWARPLSFLGLSNEPEDMVEVSSWQV
ncbi:hypothetical protein ACFX2F_018867 [Malus domestica]